MKYLSKFYFDGFGGITAFIFSTVVFLCTWFGPFLPEWLIDDVSYSDTGLWVMITFATFMYVMFQIRNYHMVKNNMFLQKMLREKGYTEAEIRREILLS